MPLVTALRMKHSKRLLHRRWNHREEFKRPSNSNEAHSRHSANASSELKRASPKRKSFFSWRKHRVGSYVIWPDPQNTRAWGENQTITLKRCLSRMIFNLTWLWAMNTWILAIGQQKAVCKLDRWKSSRELFCQNLLAARAFWHLLRSWLRTVYCTKLWPGTVSRFWTRLLFSRRCRLSFARNATIIVARRYDQVRPTLADQSIHSSF